MTVGILQLALFIYGSNSLKERRMVLNSLKKKLRNNFNVSVAQIDGANKWQRATLAVVGVGKDKRNINSILSEIIDFMEKIDIVNLIDYEMELI